MVLNIYTYTVDSEALDVTPNAFDPAWLASASPTSPPSTGGH